MTHVSIRRFVVVACSALLLFVAAGCGGEEAASSDPTFSYVIPADATERIAAGEPLDVLPRELVAQLNETIQIVNEDDQPHVVGPWFVGGGETLRQRFTTAGVFEGTCSVHSSGEFTVVVEA